MAVGEIIGAAIGILMLIIVAYLVVGSTLSTAELVTNSQKEITQQNEARLNTNIRISDAQFNTSVGNVYMNVTNTGNEIIGNFQDMDVYLINPEESPIYYSFNKTHSQITMPDGSAESIHVNQLDPGEMLWIEIDGPFTPTLKSGSEVVVVTPNGISGSAFIKVV